MNDFWRRSDVGIMDSREDRTKRTTLEIQQAIRFNLFHILQASARAEDTGVPATVKPLFSVAWHRMMRRPFE